MARTDIHIVFGRIAKATFLRSGVFDPAGIRLICLEDSLATGPLRGMGSDEAAQRRKEWLSEVSADPLHPPGPWIDEMVDNDSKAIDGLLERADDIDAIYLWTGYCSGEILSAARVVYHIAQSGRPMFQVNFPNIAVRTRRGNIIYPESLAVTAEDQVSELTEHFMPLGDKDMEYCRQIWREACSNDSLLRTRGNFANRVDHREVDHFDRFLQWHCTNEYRKASGVICETFGDIEIGIGDGFLNWRLKLLCRDGKLEYRGALNAIRDYEVRKKGCGE